MVLAGAPSSKRPTTLNPNQIRGFWAAWGGWALDGMDASIYAIVLVPALRELLPRSGIPATPGNVVRFVGCGMVFLVGAGVASYGSLGVPVAMTALAFAVGLFFLPFAEETRGNPLPI
jgi:hypothetical protein